MKLIYFIKCQTTSICPHILSQKDLTTMLYLCDLYKVGRICIYLEMEPYQTLSFYQVKAKETCLPYLNVKYAG